MKPWLAFALFNFVLASAEMIAQMFVKEGAFDRAIAWAFAAAIFAAILSLRERE